jgi:hypothetical protein
VTSPELADARPWAHAHDHHTHLEKEREMVVAEFGTGEVFWSLLWFYLFFIWMMLLFRIFGDIFTSHDLSGFAKVMWSLFVILLPFLGVFVYAIARGDEMAAHAVAAAEAHDAATRQYIREAAGPTSTAEELTKLADLKASGALTEAEFEQMKANLLGT